MKIPEITKISKKKLSICVDFEKTVQIYI